MAERVRRLRADFAVCSRAASGIDPAGMMTGLPGVWLNLAAERASSPQQRKLPSAAGKRGPKLSGGVRSPKQDPRWSAERRARRSQGARGIRMMPPLVGCASRRSASLRGFRRFGLSHLGVVSSPRRCLCGRWERARELILPRTAGEVASEASRRGQVAQNEDQVRVVQLGFHPLCLSHRTERRFARLKCVA